jgi:hypothetical protein
VVLHSAFHIYHNSPTIAAKSQSRGMYRAKGLYLLYKEGGKGGYGSRFTTKKKPFHDSRVLKKQFHGKLDSNKII